LKLFLALFLTIILPGQSAAQSNLAYSPEFVWHIAGRLSFRLSEVLVIKFQAKSEGERAEQRMQFEILYRNYLMSCDGPLPAVAKEFASFEYPVKSDDSLASPLAYVGTMDSVISPIIDDWDSKIRARLLQEYSVGKYGFLPACITEKFVIQNPQYKLEK
jgi:hypothetical protein